MFATADAPSATTSRTGAPLLEVDRLCMQFGRQQLLRDISLTLAAGETLVILGESGCGKTVLLKNMIGLVRPTGGEVRFEGTSLARMRGRELARLRTRYGFVFQQAALFDSMTIFDNVAFPLREHTRISRNEITEIVHSLLAEVGLPESVGLKKPAELSGGMRKRAGLARALALDPQLILYDEPTTGLDPIMSDVVNELILKVQARPAVTSVVVTHDMHTARKVADRIIMLYPLPRLGSDEPQIVFSGTPAELAQTSDPRVRQFVEGNAGNRLMEMQEARTSSRNEEANNT